MKPTIKWKLEDVICQLDNIIYVCHERFQSLNYFWKPQLLWNESQLRRSFISSLSNVHKKILLRNRCSLFWHCCWMTGRSWKGSVQLVFSTFFGVVKVGIAYRWWFSPSLVFLVTSSGVLLQLGINSEP